ncbi:tetratricopeptide repeat protein [Desulfoluna limicola]|nr:tetratricopeptide repeat protein [Desulfoluna limicola]
MFFSKTTKGFYYSKIGVLHFELENYYTSIIHFNKSRKYSYNDSLFTEYNTYYLGYCYLNLGDYKKAIKYLEQCINKNNEDEILELLGWCYLMVSNYSMAKKMYEKLNVLDNYSIVNKIQYAKILIEMGDKNKALESLSQAESINHDSIVNGVIKSIKYKLKGELIKSIDILENVIKSKYTEVKEGKYFKLEDLYLFLAELQKENESHKEALSTLEESHKKNSKDIWIKNALAMEYAEQKLKLKEALTLINQCILHQPENPIFIDTKAWILYRLQKKKLSKEFIEKSLNLNPDSKMAQQHFDEISRL